MSLSLYLYADKSKATHFILFAHPANIARIIDLVPLSKDKAEVYELWLISEKLYDERHVLDLYKFLLRNPHHAWIAE